MRDETQQEISAIQREAETSLGFPLPAAVWARIEDEGQVTYSPGQFDGDPDESAEFLSEYRAVVGHYIAVLSDAVPVIARQLGLPSNSTADKPERPRRLSRRPFERRLYLFDFIIQAKGGIVSRADWTAIADVWNREHPHNPQSPRNLKSRFWEWKNDDEVTGAWVALNVERFMPAIREGQKGFLAYFERMMQEHPEITTLNDLVRIEKGGQDERSDLLQSKHRRPGKGGHKPRKPARGVSEEGKGA